jgi:hypothetical protein
MPADSPFARPFDCRALTELLRLDELTDLDPPFGVELTANLKREPLGPFDGEDVIDGRNIGVASF